MKYLLLYNPVSGRLSFRKRLPIIRKMFDKTEHTLNIYESQKENDLMVQAQEAAGLYDVLLVAGGDGTINEVVNGVMKSNHKPTIGILPGGTANDTAAMLGIPRNLKRALKIFLNEQPVKIDVNQMNDRYFIYTAASGVLSKISYDVSRRDIHMYGYLAYVFAALKDATQDYKYPLKIECEQKTIDLECMMVLGLASRRVGGVWLNNFSKSKLNDGLFEIRIFERQRTFRFFKLIAFFLRGGAKLKEDLHLACKNFKFTTTEDVKWNVDGEYAMSGSVEITVHKEALPIYVHPKIKKHMF